MNGSLSNITSTVKTMATEKGDNLFPRPVGFREFVRGGGTVNLSVVNPQWCLKCIEIYGLS